jgi:hypothetical protein
MGVTVITFTAYRCLPNPLRAFACEEMPSNSCGKNKGVAQPAHVDSMILS